MPKPTMSTMRARSWGSTTYPYRQYAYVWKTDNAWTGTCRQLVVGLKDGTTHSAWFNFVQ